MELTTVKTVAVFAIIFGCFAVLYSKIFHPMVLHLFGLTPPKRNTDDIGSRMPQSLRHGASSGRHGPARGEDISSHMRGGPHPGLRANAEMKKAASQQATPGSGKGMMGVVLPMYAVGIVIYLIYTLTKVFGRKEKSSNDSTYLASHFADVRRTDGAQRNVAGSAAPKRTQQKENELEQLLMKADKEDINDAEMNELKRRLIETEAQMSRILQAMEAVQLKVGATAAATADLAQATADTAELIEVGEEESQEVVDEELSSTEDVEMSDHEEADDVAVMADADAAVDDRNYSSLADELGSMDKQCDVRRRLVNTTTNEQ